jgi:hypothetical protein
MLYLFMRRVQRAVLSIRCFPVHHGPVLRLPGEKKSRGIHLVVMDKWKPFRNASCQRSKMPQNHPLESLKSLLNLLD